MEERERAPAPGWRPVRTAALPSSLTEPLPHRGLESGHGLVSPSVDRLRDLGLAKISKLVQVRGISENANTFHNRILAPSASTDVQTLVELLIKLLLLGVECRQPLLFNLLRRGARRNLMRARLQMTDRRLWHCCYRACYRAWERVGIGHCAAEQDSTNEDNCG
jgi:hypothetical protein